MAKVLKAVVEIDASKATGIIRNPSLAGWKAAAHRANRRKAKQYIAAGDYDKVESGEAFARVTGWDIV